MRSHWSGMCSVGQQCPTLCDPMDYSLPGSSVHGILQARILQCIAIFPLPGTFPAQGSNLYLLCLLHCRQVLCLLSHRGSPQQGLNLECWTPRQKQRGTEKMPHEDTERCREKTPSLSRGRGYSHA